MASECFYKFYTLHWFYIYACYLLHDSCFCFITVLLLTFLFFSIVVSIVHTYIICPTVCSKLLYVTVKKINLDIFTGTKCTAYLQQHSIPCILQYSRSFRHMDMGLFVEFPFNLSQSSALHTSVYDLSSNPVCHHLLTLIRSFLYRFF